MNREELKSKATIGTQIFKLKDIKFWVVNYSVSLIMMILLFRSISNNQIDWVSLIITILNLVLYPVAAVVIQTILSPSGIFGTLKSQLVSYDYDGIKFFDLLYIVGITSLKRFFIILIIWLLSFIVAPIGILYLNSKIKKEA